MVDGHRGAKGNAAEAALVAALVADLRDGLTAADGRTPTTRPSSGPVYVVCPHRAQNRAVRRELGRRRVWAAPPLVGAVDKVQGREADAVAVSFGAADPEVAAAEAAFIHSVNRRNVAVTRGREKCVAFLPRPRPDAERGVGYMRGLVDALSARGPAMARRTTARYATDDRPDRPGGRAVADADACPHCKTAVPSTSGPIAACPGCGRSLSGQNGVVTLPPPAAADGTPAATLDPPAVVATPPSGDAATVTAPGAAPRSADPLPAAVGRFVIKAKLGEGTFGVVYRAHDPQLDRDVAVKVGKPHVLDSPEKVQRFLREARAAANLRHPNVVPLFEAGRDGDRYYIASAFIDGKTLEALIHERGDAPWPPADAAAVVGKLAGALAYAHSEGIVHRDVKPANVLVDAKGEPHLADFGLAVRAGDDAVRTQDGQVMGTPAYMRPEQARGTVKEVGPAADQYALGVVLYELLAGRRPFDGSTHAVLAAHIAAEPKSPRAVHRGVPRDLEAVCLKCLDKDPRRRYPGCGELAADLGRWAAGQPVLARRPGPVGRAAKWARRNPAVAALAAGLFVALSAGAGVSGWFAIEAEAEKVRADRQANRAEQELDRAERTLYGKKSISKKISSGFAKELPCRLRMFGHSGGVRAVAASLNGGLAVSGSWDATIRIWDCHSGEESDCLKGHTDVVWAVAFSPDGRRVVSGAGDCTVRVWDIRTGQVERILDGHNSCVNCVDINKYNITTSISDDKIIIIHDVLSGGQVCRLVGHQGDVNAVAFSPDGRRVVSGAMDESVRVWDARTGRNELRVVGHEGG